MDDLGVEIASGDATSGAVAVKVDEATSAPKGSGTADRDDRLDDISSLA